MQWGSLAAGKSRKRGHGAQRSEHGTQCAPCLQQKPRRKVQGALDEVLWARRPGRGARRSFFAEQDMWARFSGSAVLGLLFL